MADLLRINLLPESAQKANQQSAQQFYRTPLVGIVVGLLFLLGLGLQVPLQLHQRQLNSLHSKIQALEPKQAEVKRVQELLVRLRVQRDAFQNLKTGTGSWAKRLNLLSDITPNGVWFTELSLDHTKGLVIQGMALASQGPEMVTVTRLVQDLQADSNFASAFKQIQLESIKRVQQGDFDVVQFTITCTVAPVS